VLDEVIKQELLEKLDRLPLEGQREVLKFVQVMSARAAATGDFWAPPPHLEALAAQQGVSPIQSLAELTADFWPEDESADDFIASVRQWRREDTSEAPHA
jgi:hypothetical protein